MRRILAAAVAAFGVATVVAGSRVPAGSDPGYVVLRPLVLYNAAMGLAYLAAGVVTWRSHAGGKRAAATIFILDLLVLAHRASPTRAARAYNAGRGTLSSRGW